MRIEERCSCGAELVLVVDPHRDRAIERGTTERNAWEQVDRWRRLRSARLVVAPKGRGTDLDS